MLARMKSLFRDEQYHPTWLSVFINPFYFSRKGLLRGIRAHADQLKGALLDFGCGSMPYRGLFSVQSYTGVDVDRTGHDHSSEHIDVYYDGKRLPFGEGSFDSMFSSQVFEHIFNPDEILAEMYRVLRPGGKLLMTVPLVWDEHEAPVDFGRYTSFGMRHLMEKQGFHVIAIRKSTSYVEAVFQLWNSYLHRLLYTRNSYVNLMSNLLVIAPFTLLGIVISALLPERDGLYLDNIVLVERPR